jgi:predicted nucleotidyltransferase
MPKHGLTEQHIELIKSVLKPYAKQIKQVCLFGSRAKGTYRPNSDIDLVLQGTLDEKTVDRLWTLFQESSLPFKVDVKAYSQLTYPPLKQHMDKVMEVLLTQADL